MRFGSLTWSSRAPSQSGVIDVFVRQFDRDNFTASGIDADMQLTPGSPTRRAVLFNQPFTGAAEFKGQCCRRGDGADQFWPGEAEAEPTSYSDGTSSNDPAP